MVQAQLRDGKSGPDIAARWTEGFKGLLSAQEELAAKVKQSGDWWVAHWQSQADLVSKLAANIGSSRSLPETAMAWQQWAARCFEMLAEDCQHIRDDYQRFVEMSAHTIPNGWSAGLQDRASSATH
jgi:hypothetical protein